MALPVHFNAEVARIVKHSPDVVTYELRYCDKRPRFKPGQFVHLALEEYDPSSHWPESRVFSIASGPSRRDAMTITVSRQGRFTSRMIDEIAEGRVLSLKGPYGEFMIRPRDAADRIVLVAGGTGITPFCSFMEEISQNIPANGIWLFYGARSAGLLIYRKLADGCMSATAMFKARYYAEDVDGRLSIASIIKDLGGTAGCTFYLSGPRAMIDSFKSGLEQGHGVAPERVVIDAWE